MKKRKETKKHGSKTRAKTPGKNTTYICESCGMLVEIDDICSCRAGVCT
ncbi:MAG: hypothetical protein ACM3L6_06645 [Deltaproteobacteria bacterium]